MKLSEINPYDDYFVGTKEKEGGWYVQHFHGNDILWEGRGEAGDPDVMLFLDGDEIEGAGEKLHNIYRTQCVRCGDPAEKKPSGKMNYSFCVPCYQDFLERRRQEAKPIF